MAKHLVLAIGTAQKPRMPAYANKVSKEDELVSDSSLIQRPGYLQGNRAAFIRI